jgi:hypothetical protein
MEKIVTKLSKILVGALGGPGSGKTNPGSRSQNGTRSRIPNPDPQQRLIPNIINLKKGHHIKILI